MAAGDPVQVSGEGRNVDPINARWPTLFCVNEGNPAVIGVYNVCVNSVQCGNIPAGYQRESELVILCPAFWKIQDEEPWSQNCPHLGRNTLTPNDNALSNNQQGHLVHELAHMYGASTTPVAWQDVIMEPYAVMDAVNLNEAASLVNAASYALYYGCKYMVLHSSKYDTVNLFLHTSVMSEYRSPGWTLAVSLGKMLTQRIALQPL